MEKVLQDKQNKVGFEKQVKEKDTVKDQKSNDFIFKRYRYEENTMINGGKGKGKVSHQGGQDEYDQENKENKLQAYKKQLDKQVNHFDIVEFEEEDHEDIQEIQNQPENNKDTHCENPFQFDQDNETDRNKPQKQQKIPNQSLSTQTQTVSNVKEFDLKPMELIDFENDDQDEITDVTPVQNNNFNTSKLSSSNISAKNSVYPLMSSNSLSTDKPKSQISSTFMVSPDQSLDGGFSLEESVCNFVKKGKKFQKQASLPEQKPFQPGDIGIQKYEIHKLAVNQNPFEDAVDYSNDEELKGIKIYQSPCEDIKVQIFDKDLFVSSKIPPGIILKCKLRRSKGFFSLMNPEFDLYLENGLKHLISARKNLFRNRELFQISTQMSSFQRPIRTLMANVLHNTYWLVDPPRVIDKKKISYLDLLIEYQPLDEGMKKERQMTILCPPTLKTYHIGLEYDIPYIDFQWFKKSISLKLYFKGGKQGKVKNSEKNFELIDSDEEDEEVQIKDEKQVLESTMSPTEYTGQALFNRDKKEVEEQKETYLYLKMEKQSENVFDVEIQHPLTPLQAMAIILTRFDAQLK